MMMKAIEKDQVRQPGTGEAEVPVREKRQDQVSRCAQAEDA
jgi:hypothetical protein